jgi:hypothetical protein
VTDFWEFLQPYEQSQSKGKISRKVSVPILSLHETVSVPKSQRADAFAA